MAINFADDEQISDTGAYSADEMTNAEKTRVTTISRKKASLEETQLNILLKNSKSGAVMDIQRLGVDVVIVLNNTNSTKYLDEMRTAVDSLIQKLGDNDRLSVVTFSGSSTTRELPLIQINDDSKAKIEEVVMNLRMSHGNNVDQITDDAVHTAGLQVALQVLNDRVLKAGRVPAILLVMCNCETQFSAADINLNVPVYTFGLGTNYDNKVLHEIATRSNGLAFPIADDDRNKAKSQGLSAAFLQCVAEVLTVVQDLKLTLRKTVKSDINEKVLFRDINAATKDTGLVEFLELTFSYKVAGESFKEYKPLVVTPTQSLKDQEKEEKRLDEVRLRTLGVIEKAIELANNEKFDEAQDIIVDAQNKLEDEVDKPKESLEKLKVKLYQLIQFIFMQSKETYKPFKREQRRLASKREKKSKKPPMFTTPLMEKCLKELSAYMKNNSKLELPSIIKDLKQEFDENPSAAEISGGVSYHTEKVIETLKQMQIQVNALL